VLAPLPLPPRQPLEPALRVLSSPESGQDLSSYSPMDKANNGAAVWIVAPVRVREATIFVGKLGGQVQRRCEENVGKGVSEWRGERHGPLIRPDRTM
jgi:hypothetical protein